MPIDWETLYDCNNGRLEWLESVSYTHLDVYKRQTFARYYTPVVVILAAILAILPPILLGGGWTEWIRRGFALSVRNHSA